MAQMNTGLLFQRGGKLEGILKKPVGHLWLCASTWVNMQARISYVHVYMCLPVLWQLYTFDQHFRHIFVNFANMYRIEFRKSLVHIAP